MSSKIAKNITVPTSMGALKNGDKLHKPVRSNLHLIKYFGVSLFF